MRLGICLLADIVATKIVARKLLHASLASRHRPYNAPGGGFGERKRRGLCLRRVAKWPTREKLHGAVGVYY